MKYTRKTVPLWKYDALRLGLAVAVVSVAVGRISMAVEAWVTPPLLSPIADVNKVYVEKPVERCKTEKCQIYEYIIEKFQDDAADALTIINKCENHKFDTNATNYNRNGTVDRGIFQINSIHAGEEMYDWKQNVDMAYKIFKNRGWSAWACSEVVGVKPFWK